MTSETDHHLGMFFPTVIQVSNVAGAEELNRALLESVYKIKSNTPNQVPEGWSCDLYTTIRTDDQLHERPEFRDLKEHMFDAATKLANALKLDIGNHPLRMTSCWLNVYGPNHSQEIHNHANNILSGVYYVEVPQDAPGILFHSPMADLMLQPPVTETNTINSLSFNHQPQAGQMILFRSLLRHSVPANRGQEDRVSMAFNFTM